LSNHPKSYVERFLFAIVANSLNQVYFCLLQGSCRFWKSWKVLNLEF